MFVNCKSYASISVPPMLSFFCLSCQADTMFYHTIWLSPTMCIYIFTKISTYLGHLYMGSMSIHFLDSESHRHFDWLTNCKRLARTKYFNQIYIKKKKTIDQWYMMTSAFLFYFSCSCRLKWTMWFSKLQWGQRIDNVQCSVYFVFLFFIFGWIGLFSHWPM